MASPLVTDFPELAHLSSVSSCSGKNFADFFGRREDLEDMISDPLYFQAIFHSLEGVKDLYRSQAELGMANEAIASECTL
jgi:ESCRT-I complex subunit VPS37